MRRTVSTNQERGRLPEFVIIGAMRSGTTSLWRYLREHPDVYMAPKELEFFTEHFEEGTDWYRAVFSEADTQQICGEATADYLARQPVMTRLRKTLPEAQLIALLRNPVDRAWSHYWLLRARGRETRSFEEVIETEIRVLDSNRSGDDGFLYLQHGLYDLHLKAVLDLFPRAQLHLVILEAMVADPVSEYSAVCDFLEIDPTFEPPSLGKPVNRFVTFRSLSARESAKRLPQPLRRLASRLNTRGGAEYPALDPIVRERVSRFYAPHVSELETILGHPIEKWKEG